MIADWGLHAHIKPMKHIALILLLALLAGNLAACSGVSLRSSWLNDAAQVSTPINHVAVLTEVVNAKARPIAEDLFVQNLKSTVRATATHKLFPDADKVNLDQLTAAFAVEGVDAVLITRMVDESTVEVPTATYYPPYEVERFSRYYNRYVLVQPEPIYSLKQVTRFTFESRLYRLSDQSLIWTGVSEGFAEDSIHDIATHMARNIAADLQKKGVI